MSVKNKNYGNLTYLLGILNLYDIILKPKVSLQ